MCYNSSHNYGNNTNYKNSQKQNYIIKIDFYIFIITTKIHHCTRQQTTMAQQNPDLISGKTGCKCKKPQDPRFELYNIIAKADSDSSNRIDNELVITTSKTGLELYEASLRQRDSKYKLPLPYLLIIDDGECGDGECGDGECGDGECGDGCNYFKLLSSCCTNVTIFTFVDLFISDTDLNSIFDKDLKSICGTNIHATIKSFKLRNCPKVTSLPYNLFYAIQLTYIEIIECNNIVSVPDAICKLINLRGLIIFGTYDNDSIILTDKLWELDDSLIHLMVPRGTKFPDILLEKLHISLLPYNQIPAYKKEEMLALAAYELNL